LSPSSCRSGTANSSPETLSFDIEVALERRAISATFTATEKHLVTDPQKLFKTPPVSLKGAFL